MKEHQEEWKLLCAEAAIEQDPAKLLDLVQRINELLEEKRHRLQARSFAGRASPNRQIFQIAYDEELLTSRAYLLRDRGYDVISVLGNEKARRRLSNGESFRVFLIGHAAPLLERQQMVRWIKSHFPGAKVLALNPPKHISVPEADFNFVLNGPDEWLAILARAVA